MTPEKSAYKDGFAAGAEALAELMLGHPQNTEFYKSMSRQTLGILKTSIAKGEVGNMPSDKKQGRGEKKK